MGLLFNADVFSYTRYSSSCEGILGCEKSGLQQPCHLCVPPGWRRGHQQEEVGARLEAAVWDELCSHPQPSAALICSTGYIWSEIIPCFAWIGPGWGSAGWISFFPWLTSPMLCASLFFSLTARPSLPKLLLLLSGTLLKHLSRGFVGCAGCAPGTRDSLFPISH